MDRLKKLIYPLVLIFILSSFFILLENKYPYYFLQDDNRDQFLPYFVHNYRSLVENNEIPLYNPHQFLGTPHLSSGQTAALYPPVYLSVFLSKVLWGHYFASIDILVFLHLIIASLGFYYFLKLLEIDNKCAFFGAMTWSLSSFVVYVSTSWQFLSGVAAYFPWMVYFSLKLYKRPNRRNLMCLVISRLLLFYIGYIQYFILTLIFELLIFSFVVAGFKLTEYSKKLLKPLKYYSVSYLFTLFLSLPLLWPMWHQTSISASRASRLSWDAFSFGNYKIILWIKGLLYPFSKLYKTIVPYNWIDNALPYLSHIGYVALFFFVFCIVCSIIVRIKKSSLESITIYIYCFLIFTFIAFVWTIGLLNPAIYNIPLLNRFRWSFKVNIFVNFGLVTLAAIGLNILYKKYTSNIRNLIFLIIMMISVSNLFYLYLSKPQRNFRIHLDKIPLEEPLLNVIHDGRIISIGYKFQDQYFANGVCFDYATLWGLYHFSGYDPLISYKNDKMCLGLNYIASHNKTDYVPLDYFRNWGVKWYIVNKKEAKKFHQYFVKNHINPKFEDGRRVVYQDTNAFPLIYWDSDKTNTGISYNIKTNSINLNVNNKKDDYLVVNFLYNSFFNATIDSKEVDILKNKINQMKIYIPAGEHRIILKYMDPNFFLGFCITFVFILVISIYYLFKKYYDRKYIKL